MDDSEASYRALCEQLPGLSLEDARATPYWLAGNADEIAAKIVQCAERFSITYFTVRSLEEFAPVIAALR